MRLAMMRQEDREAREDKASRREGQRKLDTKLRVRDYSDSPQEERIPTYTHDDPKISILKILRPNTATCFILMSLPYEWIQCHLPSSSNASPRTCFSLLIFYLQKFPSQEEVYGNGVSFDAGERGSKILFATSSSSSSSSSSSPPASSSCYSSPIPPQPLLYTAPKSHNAKR